MSFEAYIRPVKYWLVCVGLLANHLFNINFIFFSNGLVEERVAGIVNVYRR
jgi:hypothetical protein